ncbi:MAG: hypothetical protein LBQ24_03930 [Candidatus Peribacteria bacterium]|jgi:hypothetical protein|nr:hypothetical protein [Candidatus Peribacteria bacterium]
MLQTVILSVFIVLDKVPYLASSTVILEINSLASESLLLSLASAEYQFNPNISCEKTSLRVIVLFKFKVFSA